MILSGSMIHVTVKILIILRWRSDRYTWYLLRFDPGVFIRTLASQCPTFSPLWLPNHSGINSLPDEKETRACSGSRFPTMVPFVSVQSGNRGGMEGMRRSPQGSWPAYCTDPWASLWRGVGRNGRSRASTEAMSSWRWRLKEIKLLFWTDRSHLIHDSYRKAWKKIHIKICNIYTHMFQLWK